MKTILIGVIALFFGVTSQASFSFSEIPWDTPAETVVKKLTSAGFKQVKKDSHGDYRFKGSLLGHEATGLAMMSSGKLIRVMVMLTPSDDQTRETYTQVREVLLGKYGEPLRTLATFIEPFQEGDGYEAEAIRSGKGVFLTQWSDGDERLIVNITPSLKVAVTYESPAWPAEMERRKNKGSAAF